MRIYFHTALLLLAIAIGMVESLAQRSFSVNAKQEFHSSQTHNIRTTRLDDEHFVLTYSIGNWPSNNSGIYARVGQVDTTTNTIEWGTALSIESGVEISVPQVMALNDSQVVIGYGIDDDGMKVPVSKDVASGDEFAGAIATTVDASEDEDVFTFNYKSLPPAGTKVFLTDDNGNIIDSSYVDTEGNFKFKKLDADKPYKMMLSDELDNSSGIDFSIYDSKGGLKKLGYAGVEGDRIFAGDAGEVGVDKFSFDFASLPKDGSMVYLTDQDGNVVDSSFVDANGNFRFKKLNPNETYLFKVDDEDFDMDAAKLYSLDDGQKRQLKKLPSSFSFNSMDLMDVADSEIDMSKYQLEYSGEIPDSAQAYLYDEETNEIIETAEIDENGNFSFKQLDSDRKFSIQFDDEIDETQAKFFVIEEEDVQLDIASAIDTSDTKDLSENVDDESELKNNLDSDWVLYFGFNEYQLTDEQQLFIEREIIPILNEDATAKVLIEGHADNKGSEAANKRMSTLRISNVVYHLEIRGFDDTRADTAPKGESSPVASNDTPEGRAKNRRVEIRIVR